MKVWIINSRGIPIGEGEVTDSRDSVYGERVKVGGIWLWPDQYRLKDTEPKEGSK